MQYEFLIEQNDMSIRFKTQEDEDYIKWWNSLKINFFKNIFWIQMFHLLNVLFMFLKN